MDNLTISCALRPLRGYRIRKNQTGNETKIWLYDSHPPNSGWNYSLNESFRFAIDFASLEQLIEAIILFENIFVDALWARRWGVTTTDEDQTSFPVIASLLEGIVIPVRLPYDKRNMFLASATWKAKEYSRSETFKDFLRLLSVSAVESAFIHNTHGYYQTGYSDKELFPDDEWIDDEDETPKKWRTLIKYLKESGKMVESEEDWFNTRLLITEWWAEMREESQVLANTDYYSGDAHDKYFASRAVMRNVIAAFFYNAVANYCNLPYFPHIQRSAFIGFDFVSSAEGPISTAHRVLECIEAAREKRVQPINAFYERQMVDLKIPMLFSAILQNVDSPAQILQAAIELRNSKEASVFRKWAADIDQRTSEGNADMDRLRKEVSDIQSFLKGWGELILNKEKQKTTEISIGLGPFQISQDIPWPDFFSSHKPHIAFLQRMSQISDKTTSFAKLVEKVFGQDIGDVYRNYWNTIEKFRHPPIESTQTRHSPLSPY